MVGEMRRLSKLAVLAAALQLAVMSQATADPESVRTGLRALLPESVQIGDIRETSMSGVYEVMIDGRHHHAYRSGKHLMVGEIFDLERMVSLKDERVHEMISAAVEAIGVESMLVFKPAVTKRHVTVFTDIDCRYCRIFHRQVPDLLKAGLEIRYLAFPRAGIGSSSYDVIVSAWCSDDPNKAMTRAKNGEDIEPLICENPVASHFESGQRAGVQGTPTMVLDDGTVIPGYVETGELLARIGLN